MCRRGICPRRMPSSQAWSLDSYLPRCSWSPEAETLCFLVAEVEGGKRALQNNNRPADGNLTRQVRCETKGFSPGVLRGAPGVVSSICRISGHTPLVHAKYLTACAVCPCPVRAVRVPFQARARVAKAWRISHDVRSKLVQIMDNRALERVDIGFYI